MAKRRARRRRSARQANVGTRRENGAGLGAFLGSLVGAVVGGLGGVPLAVVGSATGGAIGGWYGGQPDRERRGAVGGGVGGVFGPLFAALGGYLGGRKPDRKRNPSTMVTALITLGAVAVVGAPVVLYIRKRRRVRALAPSVPAPVPGSGEVRREHYVFEDSRFTFDAGVLQRRIEEQYNESTGETTYIASVIYTPPGGVAQPPVAAAFSSTDGGYLSAWVSASLWLGQQAAKYGVVPEAQATA